uniref:Uncharacterized protein n=1 Tax=Nelumbo nucifera TaxID=4432 RepID=A0A822YNG5_NELNU|nr:TPA_asm: hypothetical protein HUJ06_004697 [Nelumbo nucifera]
MTLVFTHRQLSAPPAHRPKTIPLDSILQHLTLLTSIYSLDVGTHLCQVFDGDTSIKFRLQKALSRNLSLRLIRLPVMVVCRRR